MNWKFILYSIALIIIGLSAGYFLGPIADGSTNKVNEALKSKDSALVVANENKVITEMLIQNSIKKISKVKTRLKQRDENFKNDTIIPNNNQLIQRARTITNNN